MRGLMAALLVVAAALPALAAVPATMSYQGVLRDAVGDPVPDGTYSITFRLYDAEIGGTEHWSETQSVSTAGGLFNAILGKSTALWMPFDQSFWLGIAVEGEPELAPRVELTAAPYALRARFADLELPYTASGTELGPLFSVDNASGTGIVSTAALGEPGSAGVLGRDQTGTQWGALSYHDDQLESWGVYTPDDAYVGGSLRLPAGAASGQVLTSDADGNASWQPASEFTLPYSGSVIEPIDPAFRVENTGGTSIVGTGALGAPGSAGVLGEDQFGTNWAALSYQDDQLETWGVYTPDRAYIGGHLKLPTGAAGGYVLTSDADGDATWQPASEFTLPYSGSAWSTDPIFEIENTGTSKVARFIGITSENIVEVGMGDFTGHALRLGGSAAYAKIGGGTSTGRNDIVIDANTGDVGIGLLPQEKLHVDGRVQAEDVMLTSGAANGLPLVSDATGVGSWSSLDPAGLSDPMSFGSQVWDWDFTTGRLDIDISNGNPALDVTNTSTSGYGTVAVLTSSSTAVNSVGTWVLRAATQKGQAGSFKKYSNDGYSAVDIFADSPTGLGLYVSGTITSTSFMARGVETSRGTEPVFAAGTTEPEIYASGEAALSGGEATVPFDRLFSEAIASDARVRVTVTPIGGWSALYVESTGPEGFAVRSAGGDPDIGFFWTAVGLSRDHEAGRAITFPAAQEYERAQEELTALRGRGE